MIIEFKVSNERAYLLEFGNKYIRFYSNYNRILTSNGSIYEVNTDYTEEEVKELRCVQNGDVLYLFNKNHPIRTLSRYGETDWRLEEFLLKGGPWGSVNTSKTTLKSSEITGITEITATSNVFEETDIGRLIRLTLTTDDAEVWQAQKGYTLGEIVKSDGKYYKSIKGEKSGNEKPVHTEGTKYDGGISWEYLHSGYGTARITEFVSKTKVKAEILDYMPTQVSTNSTYHWELGLISQKTGYPSCGTFFRDRFCFFVDINGIPYVCMSNSDDYNNFADMDYGEVLSTNAVTLPVYSDRYNEGRWLCASNVLFFGTSSSEFYIDSASSGDPFGPNNVKIQQISNIGSSAITPVKIGSHIIFVTATGTSIRDIVYSFNTDSYDPIDLGIYGKHLLSSGIIGMKYQEYPNKIIWFVMRDGRLVGMTFSSEQKVNALHQHDLGGELKEIAVLPSPSTRTEDLWMVINRGYECIEYLDNGIPDNIPYDVDTGDFIKKNSVYLDSCVKGELNEYLEEYLDITMKFIQLDDTFSENFSFIDGFGRTIEKNITKNDNDITIRPKYEYIPDAERNGYIFSFTYTPVNHTKTLSLKFNPEREYVLKQEIIKSATGRILTTETYTTTDGYVDIPFEKYVVSVDRRFTVYYVDNRNREIDGLFHLEGKEVSVFADGAELPSQVVKDGKITLDRDVKDYLVGLKMESKYIPQTIIIPTNNGGGVGDVQRIDHVTLTLWNSLGGSVGDNKNTYPIIYRTTTDKMGNSAPLFTGNKTIMVSFNTTTIEEKGATVVISNDSAFPMHILCISPKITTSGNAL